MSAYVCTVAYYISSHTDLLLGGRRRSSMEGSGTLSVAGVAVGAVGLCVSIVVSVVYGRLPVHIQ